MSFFHLIYFVFTNSKDIEIQIIDNESYEKDAMFYVELGEPQRDEGIVFRNLIKVFSKLC